MKGPAVCASPGPGHPLGESSSVPIVRCQLESITAMLSGLQTLLFLKVTSTCIDGSPVPAAMNNPIHDLQIHPLESVPWVQIQVVPASLDAMKDLGVVEFCDCTLGHISC